MSPPPAARGSPPDLGDGPDRRSENPESDDTPVTSDAPDDSGNADGSIPVTFARAGLRTGFVTCLPVALGVGVYGVVFGVLADQAGLSVAEATLMSATVLAGAAQLTALDLWADPVPVVALVTTTVVVNLRYVLMGATLRPWFADLTPLQRYASVFFTADENWALTVSDLRSGSGRGAFLLGSGMAIWLLWVAATIAGALVSTAIGDPAAYGLDFVLTAVFLTIAVDLWDGRGDLLPWAAALIVALGADALLAGKSYILLGGVAGGLAVVIRDGR